MFGNAGTAERLKFGVIGRAVNEVARTAEMAKRLSRPVLVSEAVAQRINGNSTPGHPRAGGDPVINESVSNDGHTEPCPLTDLGLHDLRGIPAARRLYALECCC